ncbi:MAG: PAS domain-containing protein, partial [Nocardiopsis sp. BM-2018]
MHGRAPDGLDDEILGPEAGAGDDAESPRPGGGDHLRDVFDAAPVPLLLCGRDGEVVDANRAFGDLVGRIDVVGTSCWDWLSADDPGVDLRSEVNRVVDGSADVVEMDVGPSTGPEFPRAA